eukprot:Pgem_evm11s8721
MGLIKNFIGKVGGFLKKHDIINRGKKLFDIGKNIFKVGNQAKGIYNEFKTPVEGPATKSGAGPVHPTKQRLVDFGKRYIMNTLAKAPPGAARQKRNATNKQFHYEFGNDPNSQRYVGPKNRFFLDSRNKVQVVHTQNKDPGYPRASRWPRK